MRMIDLGRPESGDVIDLIDCGHIVNVRRIVQQAHSEALLDDSEST